MNVSGIRPTAGFYQYNSIKLNELRGQQISAAHENVQPVDVESPLPTNEESLSNIQESIAQKQTFDSYDFAQQYRPDEEFDLKGTDSDLTSLDMEKAISNLDKDQVLRQYQYFVGNAYEQTQAGMDPVEAPLRSGENFIL